MAGHDSGEVADRLAAEHGIGLRAGLFCAHPLTRHLLDAAGPAPATAIRASIGAGTTQDHIDRLVAAVSSLPQE